MSGTTRRSRAAALCASGVLLGGAGLLAGCGDDDGMDLEVGEVEVASTGEGRKVTLPGTWEVGQTADMESSVDIDLGIDAVGVSEDISTGIDITSTREVTEVASGEVTVSETVEDVGVSGDAQAEVEASVEEMIGLTIVTRYEEDGRQIGEPTTEDGSSLPAEFQTAQAQLVFPTEPVGVGARWQVGQTLSSGGTAFEFVQEYELVELTDDGYVIELTSDDTLDISQDGGSVSGPLNLDGEVHGQLDNPLDIDTTFELDFDGDIDAEGESGSMTMQVGVDQTSE